MSYQAQNIISLEDIQSYVTNTRMIVMQELKTDDINLILEYGDQLSTWLATTSKCIADAKFHQDNAVVETMEAMIQDPVLQKLSPMLAKKYVDSKCKDINHLVVLADRTHSSAIHRLDWIRSQLSTLKEEMKHLNFQRG